MRYWIYWNDLVQGPFEPGELAGLKAFTADLMVCEEEGQEWAPAAAVSDLLPYFQPVTVPYNEPSSLPPPPPPPPSRPPGSSPLQGEFFNETSGQESLFDLNGSKHYYFRPAEDSVAAPEPTLEPFTTPFRFISVVHIVSEPPVLEMPVVFPISDLPRVPIPLQEPDPVFIDESELGILEPEEMIESAPEAPPVPRYVPPPLVPPVPPPQPVIEKKPELPAASAPAPVLPPPLVRPPEPAKPASPPPDKKTAQGQLTPLEFKPARPLPEPIPEPRSEAAQELRRERLIPVTLPTPAPAQEPAEIPSFDLPSIEPGRTRLWPWIAGMLVVFAAGAGMFYLKMNRAIEPPAIVETELPPPVEAPVVIPEPEPPPTPPVVIQPVKKAVVKAPPKPKPAPKPKPEPVAAPPPEPTVEAVLPGLGELEPAPAPVPEAEPEPVKPVTVNPWKGKDSEAISMVLKQKIYDGKRTIGENAKMILDQTHEKELVHAADTGQRLYLPDKLSWSSLNEEGPKYRVYLTFIAWQANGERIQARSDAFLVDLEKKTVAPADENTKQDFYDLTKMPQHQPNPKAADVESILGAVDDLNRQKVSAVVLKSSKRGKEEKKAVQAAMESAETKLQRTVVYFRTKYAEKTLQNVGKAYGFESTLKGK